MRFRVWNPYLEIFEEGCDWEIQKNKKGVYAEVDDDVNDEIVRLDLQQFTGLRDKNGKEIYEGDLVKVENKFIHSADEIEFTSCPIIFNNGAFKYKTRNGAKFDLGITVDNGDIEVIGNIYENPEFVKQNNEVKKK